ncbi:unnamed protein product [Ambrosiozyma monospora]|uniref:Unnamed protein product n=1 Tax=Ambrosiozyma monospora TaxID=43982 RepID=A0ACB5T7U2_AMBMO|nr:unnamed protein product [Ambrosiozyma monospora]
MFESVPEMVEKCFTNSDSSSLERIQVEDFIKSKFETFIKDYPTEMARVFSEHCPKLNSELLNIPDSKYKYIYANSLFELSDKSVLAFAIPKDVKLEYVKLLLKYNHTKLKDYVLGLNNIDADVLEFLEKHNEMEIIVDIYKNDNQCEKAVHKIIAIIQKTGEDLIAQGYSKQLSDKLWEYLFLGFQVLESGESKTNNSETLTENEFLLLELVESTVKLFVRASQGSKNIGTAHPENDKVLNVFKRYTQDAFTNLIDLRKDSSDSFSKIFYEFLNRSSVKVTTLGDVRPVLNEISLAYSHGQAILGIILKLVNEDIYVDMEQLEKLKLQGWSLGSLECEVCGKNIWGSRINPNVFETWQESKLGVEVNEVDKRNLEIIVFQCKHGYHTKCLDKMGVHDSEKTCILCHPK